jgi:hypothetical protein
MCTCSLPTTGVEQSYVRLSVHEDSIAEAERHKWRESEKAGRDLGAMAIRDWVREHWNCYLRAKWLEHLQGITFWIELDHDDFGLLQRAFQGSVVFEAILARLTLGKENLDILNWAIDQNVPISEVLNILETLDINSRRIECLVERRLSLDS